MSRTKKDTIKYPIVKNQKHRSNPYGLCRCRACTFGRKKSRGASQVIKIKRKQKKDWKSNKESIRGAYTD